LTIGAPLQPRAFRQHTLDNPRSRPMLTVYYSVITTNAGNQEIELPASLDDWTDADRASFKRLEDFAERVGASIQTQSRPLL
jgi:hypothetical protein